LQYTPYSVGLFAAATLSGAVAFYAWRHRGTPGAGAITLMMVAASAWSLFYALELAAVGLEAKVFWAKPQYLGICTIPLSVLAFGIRYTGRNLGTREWVLLGVLPLTTLILVFTNEAHGLIWSSTTLDEAGKFLVLEHGPFFWVYWIYSYVLIITGLATILSVFVHSGRLYRFQSAILLLGLLMPWLSNSLYVLDLLPIDGDLDLTPAAFTLTGIALAWGLFSFRLLDVVPVARGNIVEGMRDGVVVLDERDRIVDLNPAATPILEIPDGVGTEASKAVRGWSDLESEGRIEMRLGNPLLDYELTLAKLEGDRITGRVILLRDITERKNTERELVESEERYRRLVELSPDAIVVHSEGHIEYINAAGARAIGAAGPDEVLGRAVMDFVHPDYKEMVENRMRGIYNGERVKLTEEKFVRMDGGVIDVETAAIPISNNGKPAAQLVFREITQRKALEEELARQAFHDTLTGLPNRALFMDLLDEKLSSGEPGEVAILFLDLDGFKLINDSLGHECGDRLLSAAAGRVRSCVRPGDTVARIGGDEFTVLLGGSSSVGEAVLVAERISDSLKTPFSVQGHEVFVTTSIGIAVGRPPEYDASEMLRDADTAMYEAKRDGGGTSHRVFEASMSESALRHLKLEGDLSRALERDEFAVYFQPIFSLETGDIVGLEALLRWNHPHRGILAPEEFMSVAEEAGLMPEIGGKSLEETLRRAGEWMRIFPDSPITFGANLSVRQLRDPKLADEVLRLLEENDLPPEKLEIEVTEDAVIEGDGPAVATLSRLKDSGVGLAIDDFGAGYSSLSQLKRVPFDTVKIDRSLISGLDNGSAKDASEDATIVSGLVKLSHALGKKTVAEGIETTAQLERLRDSEIGCDFAQGNLFSPPLTTEEAALLFESRPHPPIEI
jgi:diguanylate cyclase (GGDEF)-like protein/PAS domain S-box-containing protein